MMQDGQSCRKLQEGEHTEVQALGSMQPNNVKVCFDLTALSNAAILVLGKLSGPMKDTHMMPVLSTNSHPCSHKQRGSKTHFAEVRLQLGQTAVLEINKTSEPIPKVADLILCAFSPLTSL